MVDYHAAYVPIELLGIVLDDFPERSAASGLLVQLIDYLFFVVF